MKAVIEVIKTEDKIVLKRLSGDTFTSVSRELNEELGDFFFKTDETPDGWVSVEEKEPELSVLYLVYAPNVVVKYFTAFYLPLSTTEKVGAFFSTGTPVYDVTHYMKLPQPPKPTNP
jgi:Protein of unknown function (DUF551)